MCFLIAAIPAHATAADSDQNLKQAVQKIGTAYAENFNRQDAAGIAALYAKEGVLVTADWGTRVGGTGVFAGVVRGRMAVCSGASTGDGRFAAGEWAAGAVAGG